MTLVAQPILDVLALIFSSAPPAPPAPSTDAALPPPRALPVPPHGRAASLASGSGMSGMPVAAGDAYSWWGDSTLEARFECGMCHMTVVQDQKKAESARLVVALAFGGEYHATREKEQGKLSVRDLRVFMRIHEVPFFLLPSQLSPPNSLFLPSLLPTLSSCSLSHPPPQSLLFLPSLLPTLSALLSPPNTLACPLSSCAASLLRTSKPSLAALHSQPHAPGLGRPP